MAHISLSFVGPITKESAKDAKLKFLQMSEPPIVEVQLGWRGGWGGRGIVMSWRWGKAERTK